VLSSNKGWLFRIRRQKFSTLMNPNQSVAAIAALCCLSIFRSDAYSQTAKIDWNDVRQQIDGFGASSAQKQNSNLADAQADLFFSENEGIGLSLLRAEIPPDGTVAGGVTMQKAAARGAKVWAAPWTPPAYMKDNNSLRNGGSLLPSYYQAYAELLVAYVRKVKSDYGIELYALSIQNEPDMTETYDSCRWTEDEIHDFIRNSLKPTFTREALTTKIIVPEESTWDFSLAGATLNDPITANFVTIAAAHHYDAGVASDFPLALKLGKQLWMTEVSDLDSPFDSSMDDGLKWAQEIHDWMAIAQVNAWHFWTLIANHDDHNVGLLSAKGRPTKRFYVLGNFSKFIRPGYYRIAATEHPVIGISMSAYKNPNTGEFVIVVINRNHAKVPLMITLDGFISTSVTPWITSHSSDLKRGLPISAGAMFSTTLPAQSVVSFVGRSGT
jgi:glucuronoarabinoxylan endo-1,4-beta-xylanase